MAMREHPRCCPVLAQAITLLGALLALGSEELVHAITQYMIACDVPGLIARVARCVLARGNFSGAQVPLQQQGEVEEAASIFAARLQVRTSLSQQLLQFA